MSNRVVFNPYQQFQGLFIPQFILRRGEISSDAKLLYAHMAIIIGESSELHLHLEFLTEDIGLSSQNIQEAYAELETYSLIKTLSDDKGTKHCHFLYVDLLYGSQKVARETQKTSKAMDDIEDIESFLNPGFERLFSTYRLMNKEYCGNRRDAYKAYLRLGNTFDSVVLLESAKNYLTDPNNNLKFGLYNFINDRLFLNYLPTNFLYIADDGEEIFGSYDKSTHLLTKSDGTVIGQLNPDRMIELLQSGRLSVTVKDIKMFEDEKNIIDDVMPF
ncbi:hypothetical protein JHD49_09250 [Sulfurimonas sp. SAG-AH-194-C21]|nr:hypothetical protein [Sulfurimonas sp. SAG-AH-194-C21]MDF1884124.1 hypothetical protein [Sulfurimonas sp. SAG-AH-194-C21]